MNDPADRLDELHSGRVAVRGGAIRAVGYGVGALIGLAWVPALIRQLGNDDFGRYVLALSVAALFAGVLDAGLSAIAVREFAVRSGDERRRFLANVLGVRIVLSVLAVGLSAGFALVAGYPTAVVAGAAAQGAVLLLANVQATAGSALAGTLRFGWVTTAEVVRQSVQALFVVTLLLSARANLVAVVATGLPASFAALALTLVLTRDTMPRRPAFELAIWRELLRDVVPFAAAAAIYVLYFRVAIVVVSLVSSAQQTGYYATGYRVIEVLLVVPGLLVGALFPVLSRAARDDVERLVYGGRRTIEVALLLGGGIAIGLAGLAPTIVHVINGAGGAVPVLRLLSIGLGSTFVAIATGYLMLALRRHRELLMANLWALAASVALSLTLVPWAGAQGGAMASVLAEIVLGAGTLWRLVRYRRGLLPSARVAGGLCAGAAAGGALLLIPGIPAPVGVIVAVAAYLAILVVSGALPRELWEVVSHRPARASSG